MGFQWIAVDAITGKVRADLPLFGIDSASLLLGGYQTAKGSLPVVEAPVEWLQFTVPWSTAILLLDDTSGQTVCVAGWYVNQRIRSAGDVIDLPLVTAEGYFDRRYVGDLTLTGTDQNVIASQLVTSFAAAAPSGLAGLPVTVQVLGAAGMSRDRTYLDRADQTIYSALTELAGVQGGIEWAVVWQHASNPERWLPVVQITSQGIGSKIMPGLSPAVTFEMGGTSPGGSVLEVTFTEDYTSSKGANYVTAVGQPDANNNRPQQSIAAMDAVRPALEYRWNPSTSITNVGTLLGHAQAASPVMRDGSRALALKSDWTNGPRLGTDFGLGDVVGYSIGGLDQTGRETVPQFPGGITGTARVLGASFDPNAATPVVTPILGGV